MSDRPTLFQQLDGIPEVQDGIWDVCAAYRDRGEIITAAVYFYPSLRYPTVVSWDVNVKSPHGATNSFGGVFRRWKEDTTLVCLRFKIGNLNVDMFWDNNISIVPVGGSVI